MLKFSIPPNYSAKLQQVCSLDKAQRKNFIILLAQDWLRWKAEHFPNLEVAPEIHNMIEEGAVFDRKKMIDDWAQQTDDVYLDAADADADGSQQDYVQVLFYRARFAASLTFASAALEEDKGLDNFIYEYSFSKDSDTDELMLSVLSSVGG